MSTLNIDSYYVTVTKGISGYFAVLMGPEGPEQTGFGRYKKRHQAVREAINWAAADELQYCKQPTNTSKTKENNYVIRRTYR